MAKQTNFKMFNFTEAIAEIRKVVNFTDLEGEQKNEETSAEVPQEATKFSTYDLKDGSKIDLSALEIGADAMLVDESGNATQAPDGEYELVDGTMISVASGKVEGVETAKAEEPGVEEEEMSNDTSEKFEAIDSNIETLKAENESLKSANKELEGRIQTLESKFSESMDQVLDLVAEIAKGPSDEPTRKPKANAFSGHESKDAKAERFLNRFAK